MRAQSTGNGTRNIDPSETDQLEGLALVSDMLHRDVQRKVLVRVEYELLNAGLLCVGAGAMECAS